MLESLRVTNFRALRDVELRLCQGAPTVLIGENATGKSSIVDAFAVLSALVQGSGGQALHDRGGFGAVAWAGEAREISFRARFSRQSRHFSSADGPVEYELTIGQQRGTPRVIEEKLVVYGASDEPTIALRGGLKSFARNVETTENEPIDNGDFSKRLATNTTISLLRESDADRYPTAVELRRALAQVAVYAGFPALLRSTQVATALSTATLEAVPRIGSTGSDLLNALYTLRENSPTAWSELLRDLRAVFPWCVSLSTPPSSAARGAITLRWRDARVGADLYLDDMSDGMRVVLATLAALHAADAPSIIAFDEPERSLHPSALRRLVAVLEARAVRTPILLATHSDRLLDFLERPEEVLRVTRFESEKGVTIEELPKELLQSWLEEFSLGELRARRLLDAPREDG